MRLDEDFDYLKNLDKQKIVSPRGLSMSIVSEGTNDILNRVVLLRDNQKKIFDKVRELENNSGEMAFNRLKSEFDFKLQEVYNTLDRQIRLLHKEKNEMKDYIENNGKIKKDDVT